MISVLCSLLREKTEVIYEYSPSLNFIIFQTIFTSNVVDLIHSLSFPSTLLGDRLLR